MREYTDSETVFANIPYILMVTLGALTIAHGYEYSIQALLGAAAYVVYGIVGALWIMVFICPYCAYYGNRGCPCGYGVISARIVDQSDRLCFSEKFKRHIPVIVPLWIIPIIFGSVAVWHSRSWLLGGLILAFAINSYIILPMISKSHGCADCPQKDDCPWMCQETSSV